MTDFCQDYQAANNVIARRSPYLPVRCWIQSVVNFPSTAEYDAHPPTSVLFVLPLGMLPMIPATLLWGLFCLTSYLVTGWLILKELGWRSLAGGAFFVFGSALWPPFADSEKMLNFSQVLTLLLISAWVCERKGHPRYAGILIGVAGLLKFWPALLLLSSIVQRRWSVVWSGVFTFVVGTLLTLLVLGPGAYSTYLGAVQTNEHFYVPSEMNLSLVSVVTRLFIGNRGPGYTATPLFHELPLPAAILLGELIAVLFLGGVLGFLRWCCRQGSSEAGQLLAYGLLVTVVLLIFPVTWYWGTVTLLLPCATLVLALRQIPPPPTWWWWALAVSLLVPSGFAWPISWGTGYLLGIAPPVLAGWITLLFDLPCAALALFAGLQAWLLWQIVSHAESNQVIVNDAVSQPEELMTQQVR
jgi:hypothetical protein